MCLDHTGAWPEPTHLQPQLWAEKVPPTHGRSTFLEPGPESCPEGTGGSAQDKSLANNPEAVLRAAAGTLPGLTLPAGPTLQDASLPPSPRTAKGGADSPFSEGAAGPGVGNRPPGGRPSQEPWKLLDSLGCRLTHSPLCSATKGDTEQDLGQADSGEHGSQEEAGKAHGGQGGRPPQAPE